MLTGCQRQTSELQDLNDYQNLSAETLADLAERANRIKAALQRRVVEMGHELTEAKKHLTHGQFAAWVERETGLSIRTAQLIMRAHALCRENEKFSLLGRSALFALSAAPVAAVTAVKERIAAGDVPRYKEVREIVKAERKPSPRPTTQVQIAKAEAVKSKAEAQIKKAEAATIMFGPATKRIPSESREALIAALEKLTSASSATEAVAVERERASLGLTWQELFVPAAAGNQTLRAA